MLVAVTGSQGMLGKRVVDECLVSGYTVYKPVEHFLDYDRGRLYSCDIIINCMGVVPQKTKSRKLMIEANAYGSHYLAEFGIPMIHVSTDCVFSGNLDLGRKYSITHPVDAITDYGRTKALGEVDANHVCNVRTSFIGPEHGLLKWLIDQPMNNTVSGWFNTAWSGSTVEIVARVLVDMVPGMVEGEYNNIEHLATLRPMTKYDLLVHLAEKYNPTVRVACDRVAVDINRALEPTIELQSCLK